MKKFATLFLATYFFFGPCPGMLVSSNTAIAAPTHSDFVPDSRLAPRVEFWKLIFSKYGKNNAVFHNRSHPHIIYSVLDFSAIQGKVSEKEFKKRKKQTLKQESARIKAMLKRLASSGPSSDENEQRIYALYEKLGNQQKELKKAQDSKQIRSQTGIKERFREGLVRSGRYLDSIERIFRDKGLPVELSRLPLIESSFDYKANSSVGAAGIWQFMRSTGRLYMRVNSALDERRDPIVASRSATRYLGNAKKRLKTWPLAVTSYNHGVAGMARAVKNTGTIDIVEIIKRYKSRTFGFASSNFWPELLAAIEIEKNTEKYFPGLVRENPISFEEVKLARSISYGQLKKALPVSEDEFKKLNTGVLKSVYQGRRSLPAGYLVRLPAGYGDDLASKLSNSKVLDLDEATEVASNFKPSKSISSGGSYRTKYKVRRGDTIGAIARKFGVSQRSLMRLNGIKSAKKLYAGKVVKIPGQKQKSGVKVAKYKVRKGDTLGGIARRHNLRLNSLKKLNPSVRKTIYPGQTLRVR